MTAFDLRISGLPDAVVRRVDQLPQQLEGGVQVGFYAYAAPGQLLQIVPGVASFLARDGVAVDMVIEAGASDVEIEMFLNGAVAGALIHQRGELPLHAATLLPPGRNAGAVAICGDSGAGKSTVAAELSRRGWRLVADDLTRISWDGAHAIAWPGRASIKLWADALDAVGQPTEGLRRVRERLEKYFLPVAAHPGPATLAAIVELRLGAAGALEPVQGVERLGLLSKNAFRPRQILPMGRITQHVQAVSRIASATRLYRLAGARNQTVAALADLIAGAAP